MPFPFHFIFPSSLLFPPSFHCSFTLFSSALRWWCILYYVDQSSGRRGVAGSVRGADQDVLQHRGASVSVSVSFFLSQFIYLLDCLHTQNKCKAISNDCIMSVHCRQNVTSWYYDLELNTRALDYIQIYVHIIHLHISCDSNDKRYKDDLIKLNWTELNWTILNWVNQVGPHNKLIRNKETKCRR